MLYTVKSALQSIAPFVGDGGECWDSDRTLNALNRARRLIYERGDYEGTMEEGCVSVSCGCFSLPRHLGEIRSAWKCNAPVTVVPYYYMTLAELGRGRDECCGVGGDACQIVIHRTGISRPMRKRISKPSILYLFAPDDESGTISFLLRLRGDSTKRVSVDLSDPDIREEDGYIPVESAVKDVLEVAKPVTNGRVSLVVESGFSREVIAYYAPGEVNPHYSEYNARGISDGVLVVFSKRKFFDFTPADYEGMVDIQSVSALEFAVQADAHKVANANDRYIQSIQLMEEQLDEFDQDVAMGQSAFHPIPHAPQRPKQW